MESRGETIEFRVAEVKVAAIIPAYNRADMLVECVRSVLSCLSRPAVLAATVASLACAGRCGELDVARAALRDGLWDVARIHAAKSGGEDAKLAVVESYLREKRWNDALKAIGDQASPGDGGALGAYYKAFALSRLGRHNEALAALDAAKPAGELATYAAYIRAAAAMAAGDAAAAAAISKDAGFASGDETAKMTAAEIAVACGDTNLAARLWREVASSASPGDRALAVAACSLGDRETLSKAYAAISEPALKNAAGLALARAEIAGGDFDAGAALARKIAAVDASADGAKETFVALADAYLERKAYIQAAETYRETMAAWPAAAHEQAVREGCAWALRKLGRYDEAAAEFSKAAEAATDDQSRAVALTEKGDTLSEAGRGEEAMAVYREVLAKYPGTAAGEKLRNVVELRELESRGRELYANFKFREAQEAFVELARRDASRKPRMDYLEMLCLYGQVRDAEAAAKARELATGSPDAKVRAESALWLAKYEFNEKRWSESRDLFAAYATNMVPGGAGAPDALLWAARAAFAGGDFKGAIDLATLLATAHPSSGAKSAALLVQGEALVESSRLDEAVVVLERVVSDPAAAPEDVSRAKMLRCDALFALGADNPARYAEALEGYESLPPTLESAFKAARTLEKLGRTGEATDRYYSGVVCAYIDARKEGGAANEADGATFVKAAFRLADEFDRRGEREKALRILRLAEGGAGAAVAREARRRIEAIKAKGGGR